MSPHHPQRLLHSTPPLATGIGAVYTLSRVGTNVVFNQKQEKITNSFFSCTLALNAVCTGASISQYLPMWGTQVFDIAFRPGLPSPHQGLSHSASGGLSNRRVTPRWVPTLRKSPLLSSSLVCFIYLSALLATTHGNLTRERSQTGAIYLSVLVCVVVTYNLKSLTFNMFLDIVRPSLPLLFLNLR